jgi:pimeloyl-ACP methyl ester carboxylesterase
VSRVTSRDGTQIAYERTGGGRALILVGGGLDDGAENAPLGPALAERFTVFNYARRGRGESGDTAPYALEREVEDIEALIAAAGGSAHLFGASSGGALALEAAASGLAVERIAIYEVPYFVDDDGVRRWREYVEALRAALADGRRSDALELFMRVAGSSEEGIAGARQSPMWPGLEALAHTLAYDAACLRDGRPPARFARIAQPVLVITGGMGGAFFDQAADALTALIPRTERLALDGASHMVDATVLAPVLDRFFSG